MDKVEIMMKKFKNKNKATLPLIFILEAAVAVRVCHGLMARGPKSEAGAIVWQRWGNFLKAVDEAGTRLRNAEDEMKHAPPPLILP